MCPLEVIYRLQGSGCFVNCDRSLHSISQLRNHRYLPPTWMPNDLILITMAQFGKSLEDYFRIPVLLRPLSPLSAEAHHMMDTFLHQTILLPIDDRYPHQPTPHTEALTKRQHITQKLVFLPQDYNNDWPEFEIIYKAKFAIGVVEGLPEKQLEEVLARNKVEGGVRVIGVMNTGGETYENLMARENIIRCPSGIEGEELQLFMEPWLYNCLSLIEAELCLQLAEARREEESNRTIVFNRMEEKAEQKVMRRKKKYRCIKISADLSLMLHLYEPAYALFLEAEEQLRKIDDYLWILGALQGRLACLIVHPALEAASRDDLIEELIESTYSVARKVKVGPFEQENYLKIARLHLNQPDKFDELMRPLLGGRGQTLTEAERFSLLVTLSQLYGECGLHRKKSHCLYMAVGQGSGLEGEVASLLLGEVQKSESIRGWPELYKSVLQQMIEGSSNAQQVSQLLLELLTHCAHSLAPSEVAATLNRLDFTSQPNIALPSLPFLELKEFALVEQGVKPKPNRIGNRESPRRMGSGFFMSWKKNSCLLFEHSQPVSARCTLVNHLPFPLRVTLTVEAEAASAPSLRQRQQPLAVLLNGDCLQKYQLPLVPAGEQGEEWTFSHVTLSIWNYSTRATLREPVRFQIYEQQPQMDIVAPEELRLDSSCPISFAATLRSHPQAPRCCLAKMSVAVYYSVDVGFQENEVVLRAEEGYRGIDFAAQDNLRIVEGGEEYTNIASEGGRLCIQLRRFKAERQFISRVEFTLEYVADLSSKYQISKQITSRCSFYQHLSCSIVELTSPGSLLHPTAQQKTEQRIIEDSYCFKIRISNNMPINSNYLVRHQGQTHRLGTSPLLIPVTKPKVPYRAETGSVEEQIEWEEEHSAHRQKGAITVSHPFNEVMRMASKSVGMQVGGQENSFKIEYTVSSEEEQADLSHEVRLTAQLLEVERMAVLRGKTKLIGTGGRLSNSVRAQLSRECESSYRVSLHFRDGWTYHHPVPLP